MKKDIFLRSTSVPILRSMTAAQLIQKMMENMDHASGRQYSIHEYVGLFSKYSERAERQFP